VKAHHPAGWTALTLIFLCSLALIPACDDEESGNEDRDCGDGSCSIATCETPVRCPMDCGACIGAECQTAGTTGSCGQPCDSSCDCINQGELCSADYGVRPGACLPTDCLGCTTFDSCSYTPDADGFCATTTCS